MNWISVNDELPEDWQRVEGKHEHGGDVWHYHELIFQKLSDRYHFLDTTNRKSRVVEVSHWREIEPPEDK